MLLHPGGPDGRPARARTQRAGWPNEEHECLSSLPPTCHYCKGPDNHAALLLQAVPFGPGVVRPSPISASLPSNAPTEQVHTTSKVCTFNTSHQTGDPGAHDGQRSAPATRKHFGKPDAESSSPAQETGPAEILSSAATPGTYHLTPPLFVKFKHIFPHRWSTWPVCPSTQSSWRDQRLTS